ncbi:stage V sporulation protein AD [Clostridium facile]|uniref:Stage V sporulation protein AD n=1 Tax=Clostridium facile TaxID=2763035 RepID=A0ABR7ITM9_9CLOT|nr:stage V sporulation protein AD [Clostridium facile]MBC5788509.1 stage V sporulation protein AD [Clostridium facile]
MRIGRSTFQLDHLPSIAGFAAVAGKKEGEGPFGNKFDMIFQDGLFGEKTFEKAESKMQKEAATLAIQKSGLIPDQIQLVFAGDLLNQCVGSNYGIRDLKIPFVGLYGACSTMAESLALASLSVDTNLVDHALAVTSSHFCSAERQFRYPLEYGGQRPPTAQWTATASGAVIVGKSDKPPYVKHVCIGTIVDLEVTDINNMGAAMAPAAADTIKRYLEDTKTTPEQYDLIVTGDLGQVGSTLLVQLLQLGKIDISQRHKDCGLLLYDQKTQDVHAGGSGCGCSAAVLCSHFLKELQLGRLQDILFVATGALMSTVTNQQGESIPGIAHLVHLSSHKGKERE